MSEERTDVDVHVQPYARRPRPGVRRPARVLAVPGLRRPRRVRVAGAVHGGEERRRVSDHELHKTWAGDACDGEDRRPIRWIDWVEFVLVSALLWIIILHPSLPGIGGGCSGA